MRTGSHSGWVALGFSFLLHAGVAGSFCFLGSGSSSHAGAAERELNTLAIAPRTTYFHLLDDPPAPAAKPSPSATVAKTATPIATSTSPPKLDPTIEAMSSPLPVPKVNRNEESADFLVLTKGSSGRASTRSGSETSRLNGTGAGVGQSNGPRFFRIGQEARSVVFVIDGSSSMGQEGSFDAAKRELLGSIEALPETTKFQVIVYNRQASPLRINGSSDLVFADEANKKAVAVLIRELEPVGGTDHVRALQQAMLLSPDAIFFVTDAADLRADQVHSLTVLNHGRSTIHAIELGEGRRRERTSLQILAEQNHGDFRSIRPSQQ